MDASREETKFLLIILCHLNKKEGRSWGDAVGATQLGRRGWGDACVALSIRDLEDDLARMAGFDGGDCRVEIGEWESVRDDRCRIELAGAEEPRHLNPGVVHLPTHDSVDGDSLEDHLGRKVYIDRFGGDAEHLNPAANAHESEGLMDRRGHAGHLEYDVGAESVGRSLDRRFGFGGMNYIVRAHLFCERQTRLVDVRRDDPRRARSLADADCEDADRAASGDEYDRSRDVRGERRMERIPHGIHD